MLLSIKALERFTLETTVDTFLIYGVHGHWISFDKFIRVLQPHANTLKELFITDTECSFFGDISSAFSFMNFTSLKHLGIPEDFLQHCKGSKSCFGLPPRLEDLQLQARHHGHHREKLTSLIKSVDASQMALKRVIWWTPYPFGWHTSNPEMENLVSLCHGAGVSLEVVESLDFRRTPLGTRILASR